MENWRGQVAAILRSLNGKAHLSNIYPEIEKIQEGLSDWKAGTRRTLEISCSDCDAWDKKHNIFQLNEKGSGNWSLRTNAFRKEILNPNTNFFILTTGKKEHRDKDFQYYTWNTHKYNKVKTGDLFIYRIPQKKSSNKQFYFFGAGKIGEIFYPEKNSSQYSREGDICAKVINPIHFNYPIYEKHIKPKDFDSDRDDWMYIFGQYGMDEIKLDRFLFLLNKGTGQKYIFDDEENEIQINAHNKVIINDYSVPDSESKTTTTRGKWQRYFRNKLILPNYDYTCAITGIKTESLLTAAHILPWAKYKDIRIDPANGICLSKLVDKCFEDKLIHIDDEYKLRINSSIKSDKKLLDQLKMYEGKKILLPVNKDVYPNKDYLRIHRNEK